MKLTEEERFWNKVEITDWCWLWTASRSRGYGRFSYEGGKHCYAHRYAWELLIGEIPEGMTLDHVCRVSHCVNPEHLRVATQRENTLAGTSLVAANAKKTHCKRGHLLAGRNLFVNTDGARVCRVCKRAGEKKRRLDKLALVRV